MRASLDNKEGNYLKKDCARQKCFSSLIPQTWSRPKGAVPFFVHSAPSAAKVPHEKKIKKFFKKLLTKMKNPRIITP